jgi:GTPase
MEILGFLPSGLPIFPNTTYSADPDTIRRERLGWDEITQQAAKVVSFIDLAGYERYLKTTLYGLTSGAPSCVILMVGGNAGLIGMSKEHLAIALALSVPVVVCITKIDMTPPNVLAETVKQVVKILKSPGCRKTPVFVKSLEMAVELASSFGTVHTISHNHIAESAQYSKFLMWQDEDWTLLELSSTYCPHQRPIGRSLVLISHSRYHHIPFWYANLTPSRPYSITEVWSVPYVGTVVNGILNAGAVKTGDVVLIGPDSNGNYQL